MKGKYIILFFAATLLVSCSDVKIPQQYTQLSDKAEIYPDYKDVVIPPNIAPMNFKVEDVRAEQFVVELKAPKGEPVLAGAAADGVVEFDSLQWHRLLTDNKGKDITVNVYALQNGSWVRYKQHILTIANDDIDPYLSYRLIEPGYDIFRQLGLYQRNLTNFDEQVIYENNRSYKEEDNHCINCHNYQNYSTRNMLFHVRSNHGGTLIIKDGEAKKIQIRDSTILAAGVYPSWHPTRNLVVFSTNKTSQTFHVFHKEKLEVYDKASDLLLYDADRNEVRNILRTSDELETFPCWSPDGKRLYFCSASVPQEVVNLPDSLTDAWFINHCDSLYYNVRYMDFDDKTMSFSEPQMLVDAASEHKSVSMPRVSSDGRYLLFTKGDYGQFHIWHKSADLWALDMQTDSCYSLKAANSPDAESYHAWSSNGRWIVFASRRMDGNFTRVFISYFDKHGKAHKAFCLPQHDPRHNIMLLKSYNVPELTKDAVMTDPDKLRKVIYDTEPETAKVANP